MFSCLTKIKTAFKARLCDSQQSVERTKIKSKKKKIQKVNKPGKIDEILFPLYVKSRPMEKTYDLIITKQPWNQRCLTLMCLIFLKKYHHVLKK